MRLGLAGNTSSSSRLASLFRVTEAGPVPTRDASPPRKRSLRCRARVSSRAPGVAVGDGLRRLGRARSRRVSFRSHDRLALAFLLLQATHPAVDPVHQLEPELSDCLEQRIGPSSSCAMIEASTFRPHPRLHTPPSLVEINLGQGFTGAEAESRKMVRLGLMNRRFRLKAADRPFCLHDVFGTEMKTRTALPFRSRTAFGKGCGAAPPSGKRPVRSSPPRALERIQDLEAEAEMVAKFGPGSGLLGTGRESHSSGGRSRSFMRLWLIAAAGPTKTPRSWPGTPTQT